MRVRQRGVFVAIFLGWAVPSHASAQLCLGFHTNDLALLLVQVAHGSLPSGEDLTEVGLAASISVQRRPWFHVGGGGTVGRLDDARGERAGGLRFEGHAAVERRMSDRSELGVCSGIRASHGSYKGEPERGHSTGALFAGASLSAPVGRQMRVVPFATLNGGLFRRTLSDGTTGNPDGRDLFVEGGALLVAGRLVLGVSTLWRHFEFGDGPRVTARAGVSF